MVISSICLQRSGRVSAFSLTELLVVIVIVSVLMGLMVPAVGRALQANRMEEAGRLLMEEVRLARQMATSRNMRVELRFVEWRGKAKNLAFRAVQSGQLNPTNGGEFIPLTRMSVLPEGVILSTNSEISSILGLLATQTSDQFGYRYVSITIKANGMLEPEAGLNFENLWFVTAIPERQETRSIEEIDNFATVQVDPWTSQPSLFRP